MVEFYLRECSPPVHTHLSRQSRVSQEAMLIQLLMWTLVKQCQTKKPALGRSIPRLLVRGSEENERSRCTRGPGVPGWFSLLVVGVLSYFLGFLVRIGVWLLGFGAFRD